MTDPNFCRALPLILLLFLLTACGSEKSSDQKVFRYNQASGITSLDPAFAKDQANIWAINQIFNSLVQFNKDLEIQPAIAKSWEVSEDGLTYTFHLRDDVYFHEHKVFENEEQRKVDAQDVAYSLRRLIDPDLASAGAWIFNDKVKGPKAFQALDDSTFQLTLQQPFGPLLGLLTMQYTSIVPEEVVEHYGKEFRTNPVGTGPFEMNKWKEGDVLLLRKNKDYFETRNGEQLPYLDAVRISFIDNKNTAYLKFRQGELDFLSGIDKSYVNEVLTESGQLKDELKDEVNLYRSPYLNTEYLGFMMDSSNLPKGHPLQNQNVRKAINYGFDRAEMIQYLRNNVGRPARSGFVPYGLPSFDSTKVEGYNYNPSKAKQLLKKAGYPNGEGLPPIELYTNESYVDITTFIQNQLKEINIDIDLQNVPAAFLRERMSKSEAPFFRGSWIADYPDAESYLAVFYGEYGAPPNYTNFNHPRFDSLYQKALQETDIKKRHALYRQLDRIIVEQAPVVPLYYDEVLRFTQKGIEGLQPNPMNLLILKNVRKK